MAEEQETVKDSERRVGPYVLREYTAHRLVAEKMSTPQVALAITGVSFLLLILAIAPWRGGTRIPIAISLALIGIGIELLIAGFVPRLERVTMDVEAREIRLERVYLLAQRIQTLRIPLDNLQEVRCRRRIWQEAPDVAAIRWTVELVGEGKVWPIAEEDAEEPMQELARLVAEVAGIPKK